MTIVEKTTLREALKGAIINWEARVKEGAYGDFGPCPLCVAVEGDCLDCPIGNGCHGTPLHLWLVGESCKTQEIAQEAVDYLKKKLTEI